MLAIRRVVCFFCGVSNGLGYLLWGVVESIGGINDVDGEGSRGSPRDQLPWG